MLSCLFFVCVFMGNGIGQPAFIVMNGANENKVKAVADDNVLAFAQTPNGRVLFSPFGAFVGIGGHEGLVSVMPLGFERPLHKNGIQPKMEMGSSMSAIFFSSTPVRKAIAHEA